MAFEGDLRRGEEHVAEARRMVQRQKGLIIRLRAAGVSTWDAQRILWLLESNLRRLEEHRDRLRANVTGQQTEWRPSLWRYVGNGVATGSFSGQTGASPPIWTGRPGNSWHWGAPFFVPLIPAEHPA